MLTYASPLYLAGLLCWIAGLAGSSFYLGRLALAPFQLEAATAPGRLALNTGAGLALWSYAVFTVSALGLLSPALALVLAAVWMAAGLAALAWGARWLWIRRNSLATVQPAGAAFVAVLGVLAGLNLLPALAPEIGWDAVAYHLALPKLYLAAGGFVFRPDIFHNLFPQLAEMLFLPALVFPFGAAAKLVHWLFGLLAACALYALGQELGRPGAGRLAALVFYAQYLVHIESGTAFIDLAPAAYLALTLMAAALALREGVRVRWLCLAAVWMGLGAAAKWHGLIPLALALMLGFLLIALKGPKGARRKLAAILAMAVCGALPVLPYLLRAWVLGGNPFWPLAYGLFGGAEWDAEIARQVSDFVGRFAGNSSGLAGLLRLPYDLVAHGAVFGVGGAELRWPLVGGCLLAVIAPAVLRRSPAAPDPYRDWRWGLAAAAAAFIAAWYFSSPQIRFLLPLFPAAAWFAALGLAALWRQKPAGVRVLAAGIGALFFLFHPPLHRDTLLQLKTVFGLVPAGQYCARYLEHYPACEFLNARAGAGETILLFGENRGFYLDRNYVWGDPMLQKVVDYRALRTPELLRARLRQLGVRWVLYRTDLYPPDYLDPGIVACMDQLLQRSGTVAFEAQGVRVYALREPGPGQPTP